MNSKNGGGGLQHFRVCSTSDCIKLIVQQHADIDLIALKRLFREIRANDGLKPTLICLNSEITIEKEARDYMHKVNKRYLTPPVAIITDTLNETLIANFYKKFYRPENPYRIFRNETEAFDWIQKEKK